METSDFRKRKKFQQPVYRLMKFIDKIPEQIESSLNLVFMKPDDNTQEILLVMNNSFYRKQFARNDFLHGESPTQNTPEQLEQACWNGLLGSILPELIDLESKLFLWEIINHRSVLCLNLAVQPPIIDPAFSLNPEFFLNERQAN